LIGYWEINNKQKMKKVKPVSKNNEDDYFAVEQDGVLKCSCGEELEKMDDQTYKCPGGYPVYRFQDGSVFIDKWGNLMMKKIDHGNHKKKKKNGKK